jgi:hypothetical protein
MPYCCSVPPLNWMAHIWCAPCYHPSPTQLTHKLTLYTMPCLAQPGVVLRWMHLRYAAQHKLALLTMMKCLQDEDGISLCGSAERVQVSASLLTKWVERFSLSNDPIEGMLKNKRKSIHPGPLSQFKPLEEGVVHAWVGHWITSLTLP